MITSLITPSILHGTLSNVTRIERSAGPGNEAGSSTSSSRGRKFHSLFAASRGQGVLLAAVTSMTTLSPGGKAVFISTFVRAVEQKPVGRVAEDASQACIGSCVVRSSIHHESRDEA